MSDASERRLDEEDGLGRLMAKHAAPTPETRSAVDDVEAARVALAASLDDLTSATQSALDIPAKIRRNPVKTAALVGGTGFLVAGGPRRAIRFVGKRIRRRLPDKHDGLLPPEIERVLKDSGVARDPDVRRALNKDFAEYLRRRGKAVAAEPNAATSFWRTFDVLAGPLGTAGARVLVQRLMEAEQTRADVRQAARLRARERTESTGQRRG